ncbi:MAG: hypothetical protein KDA46_12005, partial [Parvularculaceae bacterium]|nr:hypothetical protein [Parvularculaceae bacterium]
MSAPSIRPCFSPSIVSSQAIGTGFRFICCIAIQPNYLTTETDRRTIVEGVKIARRIAGERPLSGKITDEMRPGRAAVDEAALLDWVRSSATTIYHPTGTAAM